MQESEGVKGAELVRMLIDRGLLNENDKLVWERRNRKKLYEATVRRDGTIQLLDGRIFDSPSRAAAAATSGLKQTPSVRFYNGWRVWRVGDRRGPSLAELRARLASSSQD